MGRLKMESIAERFLVDITYESGKHMFYRLSRFFKKVALKGLFFSLSGRFPNLMKYPDAVELINDVLESFRSDSDSRVLKMGSIEYTIGIYMASDLDFLLMQLYNETLLPNFEMNLPEIDLPEYYVSTFKMYLTPMPMYNIKLNDLLNDSYNLLKSMSDIFSNFNVTVNRYIILKVDEKTKHYIMKKLEEKLKKHKLKSVSPHHYKLDSSIIIELIYDDYRVVESLLEVF